MTDEMDDYVPIEDEDYIINNVIFVDYENRHELDLTDLDDSFRVIIFVGANQNNKKLVSSFAQQELECQVEYVDVLKVGKNSLDFHIAYKLGELHAERNGIGMVYILSADKGFDSLIEYIRFVRRACIRIQDVSEVLNLNNPIPLETPIPNYDYDDHDLG